MKSMLSSLLLLATLSGNAQSTDNADPAPEPAAFRHLIFIAPVGVAENHHNSVTVGYERQLGRNSGVYLTLPVTYSHGVVNVDYEYNRPESMVYFSPGVKTYFPKNSRIRYGLGASVTGGIGNKISLIPDTPIFCATGYSADVPRVLLGGTIDNSFNAFISNTVYLGLQLSVGPKYLELVNDRARKLTGMAFFSFRVGVAL